MRTRNSIMVLFSVAGLLSGVGSYSCERYLNAKPDQKLAVPNSLDDLQGLLDNYSIMNQTTGGTGEAAADNYYLEEADWNGLSREYERRLYIWGEDHLFAQDGRQNEWYANYQAIYLANHVLGLLDDMKTEKNEIEWSNVKGQALYFRAQFFLRTALLWAPAYDDGSPGVDLGIPLRMNDDFNVFSTRASVQETYDQILRDLKEAAALLPVKSLHQARPSKPAAYGLLARTYLSMRKYESCGQYADSCLRLYNKLLDYNTLDPQANFPIVQFNEEVIQWNRILDPSLLSPSVARIDSNLYESYAENDLRKDLFFSLNPDSSVAFKGYYEGLGTPFGGVAVDEVLLMRAECYARTGDLAPALADINLLLENRYKEGTFGGLVANTTEEALKIILKERRKQLVLRDLRWMDLKRFNKEGADITLKRILGDDVYTLPPNDLRYAMPIPEDVIELSGIIQNPR